MEGNMSLDTLNNDASLQGGRFIVTGSKIAAPANHWWLTLSCQRS